MITAAVLTGGVAIAGSTSGGRVIHACVSKSTGVMRIAAHCLSDENPLSWNDQGLAGPPGAAGPSSGYAAYSGVSFGVDLTTSLEPIGPELSLPGGAGGPGYVVSAEVLMQASSDDGVQVLCELSIGHSTTFPELDAGFETFLPNIAGVTSQDRVMPLTASGTVYGATTAQVQCQANAANGGTDTVFVSNVRITAIRLGTLNVTVGG